MEIPVAINGYPTIATLDTGAEVNCLSADLLSQIPDSDLFVRRTQHHKGLLVASKQTVPVLECVEVPLQVGQKIIPITFYVLAQSDLLLGLPALQKLKTKIDFQNKQIQMKLNSVQVDMPDVQAFSMILTNKQRFVLRPGQTKKISFLVRHCAGRVPDGEVIEVQSHRCQDPVILPSICTVDQELCTVPVRNTGKKKIKFAGGLCVGVGRIYDAELFKLERVTEEKLLDLTTSELGLGKLDTEKAGLNSAFYSQYPPSVRKVHLDSTDGFEGDPLFELDELPLGCPDRPQEDLEDLMEEQLDPTIPTEHRDRIKEIFRKNPTVVATYFFDAGNLRNHEGEIIKVKVPLRKEIVKNTKTYKLSSHQLTTLHEIFDHLVYNNLAEEVFDPEMNFGCPVFLVERSQPGGQGRPARVILDQRQNNSCLLNPLGTPGESVSDSVARIAQTAKFCTSIDLRNAYYSIHVHEDTLKTGLTQILSTNRCLRLLRAPTGGSWVPLYFRKLLYDQLCTSDQGTWEPLFNDTSNRMSVWFDDVVLSSNTTAEEHLDYVEKVVQRLCRMDVRINLKKSEFVKDLETTSMKILGFQVSKEKIRPDPAKIDCIKEMQHPKNFKDVQRIMGHITFIRELLPLRCMELLANFSHLSSSKAVWNWTDTCADSFEELKEIISSDKVYLFAPPANTIKIIYTDASLKIYAANAYSIDLYQNPREKIGENALPTTFVPLQQLPVNTQAAESLIKHFDHFMLVESLAMGQLETESSAKEQYFSALTKLFNFHHKGKEIEGPTYLENYLLGSVDFKIMSILPFFHMDREKCDQFLVAITKDGISDEIFTTYFEVIVHITALVLNVNIGLSFIYDDRVTTRPFVFTSQQFHFAPLLLGVYKGSIFPLLSTQPITRPECQLPSSLDIFLSLDSTPDQIYTYFRKVLKDSSLARCAKIVGHFSATIPLAERNRPIFELESKGLLLALTHFENIISDSSLTLAIVDSRVAFFLFSRAAQEHNLKSSRLSVKLALKFPTVRLITCTSKANQADLLSKLGADPADLAAQSLYVVGFEPSILAKLGNKYLTWTALQQLCAEYPNAIRFSEKRMDKSLLDQDYVQAANCLVNTPAVIPTPPVPPRIQKIDLDAYVNIFDRFLNRNTLLAGQKQEFSELLNEVRTRTDPTMQPNYSVVNDILLCKGKIVLPTQLYLAASLREHFYATHSGPLTTEATVKQLYWLSDLKSFKHFCKLVSKLCLSCLAVNHKQTKLVNEGFFPHRFGPGHFVMADLIEGLGADGQQSILNIIDCYSRYITCFALTKKTTVDVITAFNQYFAQNGPCKYLATDNASIFRSEQFQQFAGQFNIHLVSSTPYRSKARALVENSNRQIQEAIMKISTEKARSDWKTILSLATFFLNRKKLHYHPELSPYQMHHHTLSDGLGTIRKDVTAVKEHHMTDDRKTELERQAEEFSTLLKRVEVAINARKTRNKNMANEVKQDNPFHEGDFCMVRNRQNFLGKRKKFALAFMQTPYQVTKVGPTYLWIQNIVTKMVIRRSVDEIKRIDTTEESPWGPLPVEIVKKLQLLTPAALLEGGFEKIYNIDPLDKVDLRLTRESRARLAEEARQQVPEDTVQDAIRDLIASAPLQDEFYDDGEDRQVHFSDDS